LNTIHLANCPGIGNKTIEVLQNVNSPLILLSCTGTAITKEVALRFIAKKPYLLIHCSSGWDKRGFLSSLSIHKEEN